MTNQFQGDVTSDDKLWAALAYALSPIVPVIVLLMADKKDRPFIKANNIQALVTGLVLWVLVGILSPFTCGISLLGWIVMFVLAYQAYQGKTVVVPVITDFCKGQGWA